MMKKKIEKLLNKGYDSFEIAETLSISVNEVEKVVADLYEDSDETPTLMYEEDDTNITDLLYENGFDNPSNRYYE
jgi:hypothetical protein